MHRTLKRGAYGAALASLLLTGAANMAVSQHATAASSAAAAANVDWPRFGNNSDNTRFSTLSQINDSNVSKLGIAWTQQEGPSLAVFETDPVVVDGIMYYTTNTDQVRAVNAATGATVWQYTPKVNFALAISGGGGGVPVNRGVTVENGRVYLLTFDDQLISLQAATGEKLWSSQVSDPNAGYSETSPATYYDGLLIVGSAESDAGERGFVAAFDANTGKQVWRYYTVPAAGQGWNQPAGARHGGGDVWMPSVVDTTTGIVYFGTGNPSPDLDNSQRPGCDPWVNATVALNAKTGKFLWAHTEFCNDQWDYDSHQPPMIFNLTLKNGQTIRAVGHGNKSSFYYVYNALTGEVIAKTPPLMYNYNKHIPPTVQGTIACPTASGGIEYSPPAFSPLTQDVYETGLNTCAIFKLAPVSQTNLHAQGAPDFGGTPIPYGKTTGFIAAVDPTTGKIVWRTQLKQAMVGGALATAGNLVFSGCDDGNFYAFDATTGKALWKANLGLDFGAAPITYEVNGVQYVAIADGGSVVSTGKTGGTMVVFKLNGGPIHQVPAVVASTEGVQAAISTKGLTQINPYMWINASKQHVVIKLVAASSAANSGFNFDGYFKGAANFIVPGGWAVDWIFTNDAALNHSAALATSLKPGAPLPLFGFGAPVETPNAAAGVHAGTTQYVGFGANQPGKYYLICAVPGHVSAGMWDYFTISTTAKLPSIQAM